MKKRILSFLLALAMILPLIPATQIAANAESTDVVVVPKVNGTQSVDLSQVNSALEFAEGTTNAYCYACGKVATWVSLDDYDPADYWKDETATTAWLFGEHHYYVPETEGDYTFGEVTPVRLNFMEIGLNSSVCLHLNGQNLVTAGNAHNGGGTFSLMGEGSWVSTYIDEKTHESDTKDERLGSVVNNYASGAVSNLFGGELSSGETGGVYVISFGAAGTTAEGTINIYRDVTVNGNIFTRGATINVNGATINGRVYMMDHNADKVCGTFNMVGGVWNGVASIPLAKPVDGEVGYGGAIYAEAGAVVNLTDVEINGAHVAGNGGAICTKDATVNIKGCTIRGGQSDAIKAGATSEEMYGGGNIYVASTALTIEDTEISDGIAAANGGNILAYGNCAVTLKTGTVIYNGRSTKTGTVNTTVDNKGFTYNGGGGNVYVHGAASTLVVEEGTQIYGGSANYKGKDIATADGAKVTIAGTVGSADKAGATTVLYVQKTNPIADLLEVTGGTIYGQIETVRGNVKFNGGTMICSHATSIVNKQSATITANHGSFSYNPSGYLGENTTLVTVGEMHNVHKNVTLAQATDATCREPGKIDHYTCALCDLTFADAECTQQISAIDSTKPAHTQTAVAEQPAECTAKGVKAYWECNDCEKLWADEACTQEIKDLEAWKNDPQGGQIPEAEHAYAYEFKDAEAHTVRCTTCGEVFADGPHNTLSAACELCGAPKLMLKVSGIARKSFVNTADTESFTIGTWSGITNVPASYHWVEKAELYHNDTPLLTVTLKEGKNYSDNGIVVTLKGTNAMWDTQLADGVTLTEDNIPNKVKLYADGVLVHTYTNANGYNGSIFLEADKDGFNQYKGYLQMSASGHEHTLNEGEETTPATCLKAGELTKTCSVCDGTVKTPVPQKAHEYDENGVCKNGCENTKCENNEHEYDQKNANENYQDEAATCEKAATYFYSCKCGAKGTETFEGAKAPHAGWWFVGPSVSTWEHVSCGTGEETTDPVVAVAIFYHCEGCDQEFYSDFVEAVCHIEPASCEATGIHTHIADCSELSVEGIDPANFVKNTTMYEWEGWDDETQTYTQSWVLPSLGHDYKVTYTNDGETHTKVETCANDAAHKVETSNLAHVYDQEDNTKCVCGAAKPQAEETNQAQINGQKYETLQAALTAAAQSETPVVIDLLKDTEVGMTTVADGVTLNLNGKTLTVAEDAYVIACFETSFITDTEGTGRIVVDIDHLLLLQNNGQLPVQTETGIMFVDAALKGNWSTKDDCFKFWFDEETTDAALIEQLKKGSKASELKIQVELSYNNGLNKMSYVYDDAVLAQYLAKWDQNACLTIAVQNVGSISDLTFTAKVVFADGTEAEVNVLGAAVEYGASAVS